MPNDDYVRIDDQWYHRNNLTQPVTSLSALKGPRLMKQLSKERLQGLSDVFPQALDYVSSFSGAGGAVKALGSLAAKTKSLGPAIAPFLGGMISEKGQAKYRAELAKRGKSYDTGDIKPESLQTNVKILRDAEHKGLLGKVLKRASKGEKFKSIEDVDFSAYQAILDPKQSDRRHIAELALAFVNPRKHFDKKVLFRLDTTMHKMRNYLGGGSDLPSKKDIGEVTRAMEKGSFNTENTAMIKKFLRMRGVIHK